MMASQPSLTTPDGSSNGNPPKRYPRPLYSRDSTQEGHTNPHRHPAKELKYIEVKIKKEEETNLMVNEPSKKSGLYCRDTIREDLAIPHHHQDKKLRDKVEVKKEEEETFLMVDQQSMEEGGLLNSRDSSQEDIIPHHHLGEELNYIKVEVKEEEETFVSGDQPSMEDGAMIMERKQEESSLHMESKKILRDSFRRQVNKAQATSRSGAASHPKSNKPHPYPSQLHFLRPSKESRETTCSWVVEDQEEKAEQRYLEVEEETPFTFPDSDTSLAHEVVTPHGSVYEEAPVQDSSPFPVSSSSRRGRGRGRGRQQRQTGAIEDRIVNLLRNFKKKRPSPFSDPTNPKAAFCILMFHTLSDLSAERSKQAMDSIVTFLAACRSAQRSGLPSPTL